MNTFGASAAPTSGSPSAVTGRDPTHWSCRSSRFTPVTSGRADFTIASIRSTSSGASVGRNSIVPATRSRPLIGVHATRCAAKYTGHGTGFSTDAEKE